MECCVLSGRLWLYRPRYHYYLDPRAAIDDSGAAVSGRFLYGSPLWYGSKTLMRGDCRVILR